MCCCRLSLIVARDIQLLVNDAVNAVTCTAQVIDVVEILLDEPGPPVHLPLREEILLDRVILPQRLSGHGQKRLSLE